LKASELAQWLTKPLSKKFVFKLAQTREELEACFHLLHDEYVRAGFMEPDLSRMRVTIHHALPMTSTLMCCYEKRVVGTVSLIRENGLGFPMQQIFDLDGIAQEGGNVAEVSALAIDNRLHAAKGRLMMPLLKFLYEYAEYRFDTRHLVIAVHPKYIGFYEDVLCFRRLPCPPVDHYSFVNGMPAIGAHLDLEKAKEVFSRKYGDMPLEKNLFHYFAVASLPNGQFPHKRFDATTDPVMTPKLIDYFFNQKTKKFSTLSPQEIRLLHTVYNSPEYQFCLPQLPEDTPCEPVRDRAYRRYPVKCPAYLQVNVPSGFSDPDSIALAVYECSEKIFCALADKPLSAGLSGQAIVELDAGITGFERCTLPVEVVRLGRHNNRIAMLRIRDTADEQGELWLKFIRALSESNKPVAVNLHFSDGTQTFT
jgi:hypothetical protein